MEAVSNWMAAWGHWHQMGVAIRCSLGAGVMALLKPLSEAETTPWADCADCFGNGHINSSRKW